MNPSAAPTPFAPKTGVDADSAGAVGGEDCDDDE